MNEEILSKLDPELFSIYNSFSEKKEQERKKSKDRYLLTVHYSCDLKELEEFGFEPSFTITPGRTNGYVFLRDLYQLAAHEGVLGIRYGSRKKIYLDKSVEDIHVRSGTTGAIGTDGLWHINTGNGAFTSGNGIENLTGAGVIIGIIDTGIDVNHPGFRTGNSPNFDSRIYSVWDQGLTPAGSEKRPDKTLLTSSETYGVEYDRTAINTSINGAKNVRTKDCAGHGTHVAGIAAGNGIPGDPPPKLSRDDYDYPGVAPKADIIAVKYLDVPEKIKDKNGSEVGSTARFHDAIMYIIRKAAALAAASLPPVPIPVVINCSFGSSLGPHDGMDDDEIFLDSLLTPGSPNYVGDGNIVVYAAGNEAGSRTHARITMPAAGEIIIPLKLYDKRENKQRWQNCEWKDSTSAQWADIWYKDVSAPQDVSVQCRELETGSFSSEVFSGYLTKLYSGGKQRTVWHSTEPVQRPHGGSTELVSRNRITLKLEPNKRVTPGQHAIGKYELKINGPSGTAFHLWTTKSSRQGLSIGIRTNLYENHASSDTLLKVLDATGLKIGDSIQITLDNGSTHTTTVTAVNVQSIPGKDTITIATALPGAAAKRNVVEIPLDSAIVVEDKHLIGSEGGASSVITVAAYDDNNGKTSGKYRHIANFSSRGPLVDYSGLGPLSNKPEITAPGVAIHSAISAESEYSDSALRSLLAIHYYPLQGTSMAAPHIAGLIALYLQRDPTLNVNQVKAIFNTATNNDEGLEPQISDADYVEAFGNGIANAIKSKTALP